MLNRLLLAGVMTMAMIGGSDAQEPDGHLFTARTADPDHPQPGIGATRWSELAVSHELYNAGHVLDLVLPDSAPLTAAFRPGLLGGVVAITGHAKIESGGAGQGLASGDAPIVAIPYCAWANRGPGEMTVWLKRRR